MHKPLFLLASFLALLPTTALAYSLGTGWTGPICAFLPCTQMGGGSSGLASYVLTRVISALQVGFVAIAALVLFFAAINMVLFPHEDEVVKEGRSAFIYTLTGGAFVAMAQWAAQAFAPLSTGANLVNASFIDTAINNVLTMARLLLAILLTVNIVVQAFRLITSQGEQDQAEKARKRMIASFIGVGFVMTANVIAVSVLPGASGAIGLAEQIAGIANYLLTIVGFAAVVDIIIAGVLLIFSVDEGLKDKAKTAVKIGVIGLLAVVVAYALVAGFINLQ